MSQKSLADSEEVKRYGTQVNAFISGTANAERFMAFRLQHGIYGQRQENVHMVRVKLPGGNLNIDQLTTLSDILTLYSSDDAACITTRQDIQFHFVKPEN